MKPNVMPAVVMLALIAVGCGKTESKSTSSGPASNQAETKPHWDYPKESGPEQWGRLSPDYVLAAIGRSQSPIDIVTKDVTKDVIKADLPPLEFETCPTELTVLSNGHTVEALAPGASNLEFLGQGYTLTQYHFHAPSEHTIDGEHADMELHFVHSNDAGHLAVVAVLYDEGEEDHPFFLSILKDDAPVEPGEEKVFPDQKIDIAGYFPPSAKQRNCYMYDGSLTTPPATEGVRWFVCAEKVQLSRTQIESVRRLYFHNNRPIQPTYVRTVLTPQ
jgi:carbonic anhydrase